MTRAIVPIVEGQSEAAAVPGLLRRILCEELASPHVSVAQPFRVKRNRVVRAGELERAVIQSVRSRPDAAAVLVAETYAS